MNDDDTARLQKGINAEQFADDDALLLLQSDLKLVYLCEHNFGHKSVEASVINHFI